MPTTPIWEAQPQAGQQAGSSQAGQQAGSSQAGQQQAYPQHPGQQGQSKKAHSQQGRPQQAWPHQSADARGFLSALFDFSFTSFVTTRIIKVLYVLILILVSLSALVYTIVAFKVSPTLGLLTLVIGDPLFIVIVMGFWRLILESFVVVFRIAEDTRAMRERGDREELSTSSSTSSSSSSRPDEGQPW